MNIKENLRRYNGKFRDKIEGKRQIVKWEGSEDSFREVETRILREVLKNNPTGVIALGGGAWTFERNRNLMNKHGCVTVWLDAPFELCWERILISGGSRPLARDEGYDAAATRLILSSFFWG